MTIYDDKRSAELLAAELQAEIEESAADPTTAQPATPGLPEPDHIPADTDQVEAHIMAEYGLSPLRDLALDLLHDLVQTRAEVRRLRADLVVLGADRDILDQQANAHEGEMGDLRAKLAAADTEVDRLRAVESTLREFAEQHADLSGYSDVVVTDYLEGIRDASQKLARCVLSALDDGPATDPDPLSTVPPAVTEGDR